MDTKPNEPSFENSLEQLSKTAKALESGQLTLEESLAQFESGMKLAKTCAQYLQEAEKRVEILMKSPKEGSAPELGPFGNKA